jgi:glucose/arabinose dehydrogenase
MKNIYYFIAAGVVFIVLIWGGYFIWKNFRGSAPAFQNPSQNIADLVPPTSQTPQPVPADPQVSSNSTNMPLTIPNGFSISIFSKNVSDARVLVFDSLGNLWVSRPTAGTVTKLTIQNGLAISQQNVFSGLNRPHGLAFDPIDPNVLFIAEEDKISKASISSPASLQKIIDLPTGGVHTTRSLLFGLNGRLYVSIGSSCNVCVESDPRRAAIYSLNKDGSDFRSFASGLRNAVFMATNPKTNEIWATDMGRDLLGDNVPPDTINIIKDGKNYGWPYCYGKQVHDSSFDPSGSKDSFCLSTEPSHIDIQAHSAPLGLDFLSGSQFPSDYQNDLLVAFHGFWNRSVPTGYKIARFKFDSSGKFQGQEDFITGWLTPGSQSLGRPVAVVTGIDGKIYISDDKAGVIYQVTYQK